MPPPPIRGFFSLFLESSCPFCAIWLTLICPLRWRLTSSTFSRKHSVPSPAGFASSSSKPVSDQSSASEPELRHIVLESLHLLPIPHMPEMVTSVSPPSCPNLPMVGRHYMLGELNKCTNEKSPLTRLSLSSIFLNSLSLGLEYQKTTCTMRAGVVPILFPLVSAGPRTVPMLKMLSGYLLTLWTDPSILLLYSKSTSSAQLSPFPRGLSSPYPHVTTKANITEEAKGHKKPTSGQINHFRSFQSKNRCALIGLLLKKTKVGAGMKATFYKSPFNNHPILVRSFCANIPVWSFSKFFQI